MANQEHLDILRKGVEAWNQWRRENSDIRPDLRATDLSRANLSNTNLRRADLSQANLRGTNLNRAILIQANLSRANLSEAKCVLADISSANLVEADLSQVELPGATLIRSNLRGTNLNRAILIGTDLSGTNLRGADLREANLSRATLVGTILNGANLTGCSIYGISAWDVKLEEAQQNNLVITRGNEPTITVDNLKVAQFIYLLLNNAEIRDVIDTITSKVVLILGRFTPQRKAVLDALREELRNQNYTPMLFDFEKPASRDVTETISTLAHMARFVIADITDAKSIPQELQAIVPNLPSVPVQPLILNSQHEYGMFEHFTRFPWVLPAYRYTDEASLLASLHENVIEPAELKAEELARR